MYIYNCKGVILVEGIHGGVGVYLHEYTQHGIHIHNMVYIYIHIHAYMTERMKGGG